MQVEKEPVRLEESIRNRRYGSRARDGFRHLLSAIWPGGEARVLLPAYVGRSPHEGSGILDPLEELGIPHSFYRVHPSLELDLESLEREMARGSVFAVLVVHYFGMPQRAVRRVRQACDEAGVSLIEDCCHSLDSSVSGVGDVGDYALFSVHKVLPCDRGGILQVNTGARDPGPIPGAESGHDGPARLWRDAAFERIASRRIENYGHLCERISGIEGYRLLWPALPSGGVPLNLPILIDRADRYEVYKRMREVGVGVVALYHTLVDSIRPDVFPDSHAISRKILNLPIHQDLRAEQLELVASALGMALDSSAA